MLPVGCWWLLWDHVAKGAGGHSLQGPVVGTATAQVAPGLQVAVALPPRKQVAGAQLPAAQIIGKPCIWVAGLPATQEAGLSA